MSDVKKPIRLADVGELEADLKKDLAEEEAKQTMAEYIERRPLLEAFKAKCCEDCPGGYDRAKCKSWCDAADEIALVEDAPAVVPDAQRWRDPETDPPKVETEVLILYRNEIDGYEITTAHYEDGSVFLQDSVWYWEDLPDWGTYDEERDDYKIPKGWWEYRHFNPDDVYNNKIDRPVVGWMPLPPKEITK